MRHLKAEQFAEDGGPLAHPVRPNTYKEINNFYTTTVYQKGSEVTRMIATLLGRDGFRKGMDLYFDRHDGQAVTIEDFVACFEETSGQDLTQFSLWYRQAGTPLVMLSGTYDAGRQTFTLALEQMVPPTPGQTAKEPMHIPLKLALLLEDGSEAALSQVEGSTVTGDVLHLTERQQTAVFHGIASRPVLSINRGFSAPINLQFSQSAADLAHIARNESDLFARWQALSDLALPSLVSATQVIAPARRPTGTRCWWRRCSTSLADPQLEPAFRALALTLPAEADIARAIGANTDPDAIHLARQHLFATVAEAGTAVFASLVETLQADGAFSPDADSAGRRALRGVALGFLAAAEQSPRRAKAAYDAADNMTDLSQALCVLAHHFPDAAETAEALAAFRDRFGANPLVMDKWFSIQATIPGEAALPRLEQLLVDPVYNAQNPNRVRALIGSFAFQNGTGFNRKDGRWLPAAGRAGARYRPAQSAARRPPADRHALLALAEPVRAAAARAALEEIAAASPLSADVGDIVERMLKG